MSDEVMEGYVRQMIEAQEGLSEVEIAWQGGEPTLMGIDFFRRAVEAGKKYARPGQRISKSFQTNGVLIDADWCRFLRENDFLVGLSLDGPRELHDAYRHDKAGRSVFDRAVRAARLMKEHGVEFNILCTVNAANSRRPLDVYRFFRDELGARYVQLIPIVERENETGDQDGGAPDGAVGRAGGVRALSHRHLRRVGPAGRRRDVRHLLRQRPRRLRLRRVDALRPAARVRGRAWPSSTTATSTPAIISSSRGISWEHPGNAARGPGRIGEAAGLRPGQGRDAAARLPRVPLSLRLSRRVPEEPRPHVGRRRDGAELALRRAQGLLRPYGEADAA